MRRLSGWDAYMLYSEAPTVHNHTLKVAVVAPDSEGRPLTIESFRAALEAHLPRLEPLRYRLVQVGAGLHHPMWRENCVVDLDQHLFRATAPAPGDHHALDKVVGNIATIPLRRDLPLWSLHFVDGLADGHVALVAKVHHALADGMASANLLSLGVQRHPDAPSTTHSSHRPDPDPARSEVIRAALRDHGRTIARLPGVIASTAAGVARSRRDSLPPVPGDARPLRAPPTLFNRSLSSQRSFSSQSLHLPTVKTISKSLGVTVNDVVLALASGALREYLLDRGQPAVPMLAAVAVATDRDPNRLHGNHMAGLLTSLPADEDDPIERCRRVHRTTTVAKHNVDVLGLKLIGNWLEYLPPRTSKRLFAAMSSSADRNRLFNLPMSNVPGPREPIYIAGHLMSGFFSVGPLYNRSGLNITVWSYLDQLNVSVLSDPLLVPDPDVIATSMARELQVLQAAMELEVKV